VRQGNRKLFVVLSVGAAVLLKTAWDRTIQIATSGQATAATESLFTLGCWVVGLSILFWAIQEA
jgi:hypothetical protein